MPKNYYFPFRLNSLQTSKSHEFFFRYGTGTYLPDSKSINYRKLWVPMSLENLVIYFIIFIDIIPINLSHASYKVFSFLVWSHFCANTVR